MNRLKDRPTKQLADTLDAYAATAADLDAHPLSVDLWRLLCELGSEGNELFRRCGGEGEPFKDSTDGLDVFFVLRRRELEALLRNPNSIADHVGKVSDWVMVDHLRERVAAVIQRDNSQSKVVAWSKT